MLLSIRIMCTLSIIILILKMLTTGYVRDRMLNFFHLSQSKKKNNCMKKFISTIIIAITILCVAVTFTSCSAYVSEGPYRGAVVAVRPAPPYYARPFAPYPNAVWIDGEWAWRGGRYEYINGYWARPDQGRIYIHGHWKNGRGGYYWVPGHWR